MLRICLLVLAFGAGSFVAPAQAARASAEAKLLNLNGQIVGYAHFRQMARGVMIEIRAVGLKPGAHAVMIHTSAACDPKKGFYTAGPDLDFLPPRPHGFRVTGGPRPGDLPNQYAGTDGVLHAEIFTTYFTLGSSGKRSLFDRDGASVIIHETGDDYLTPPDGNSGRREACGTIIRTQNTPRHSARKKHS